MRWRTWLLALAVGVAFADSSIVVLALPDLLSAFDTTIESISWVITAYNVAVAVVALALIPSVGRLPAGLLTQVGLVLFCAASLGAAASDGQAALILARAVQGVGGALLLAGALPLLGITAGSTVRGAVVWGAAGVIGAALGPALGGALTQVFDWRSIFIAQVPLAAAALLATRGLPRSEATVETAPMRAIARGPRLPAGIALGLLSAALVGALFLSVVLMIDGWGHEPLVAAGVVTAVPAFTLLGETLARASLPMVAVAGGIVLVAGGLLAMALLPEPSLGLLATALALCGLGLGLSGPALTAASLRGEATASATWSVGARHAGLVLGLVLMAPLLAHSLGDVSDRAQLAGANALIDAPLSIGEKVDIGRGLQKALDEAPAGEVPDLRPAIAAGGDPDDPGRRELRDRLEGLISTTITQGFRNAFILCAVLAALALLPLVALRREGLR
jgi:predicted MFS family arabinose efflux permease